MDENKTETNPETPTEPAKAAAPSRASGRGIKRDSKRLKLKAPKPTKSQRGKVRQ